MSWANEHIQRLLRGESVRFRPQGNSMVPRIMSGQLVTVVPIVRPPRVGDVVLCKCNGRQWLHNVSAIQGSLYQISNNRGHANGWIRREHIYGVVTKVED